MSRAAGAEAEEGVEIDSVKCALQADQEQVQKRTFTSWINAQLAKHKTPSVVQDLFQDLRNGHQLLDLLEVLSGQQLDHERNRTNPISWRSNVGTALKFLRSNSVKLVNINVPDIVEGKSTIILGLMWSIVLHFQVKAAVGEQPGSGQGEWAFEGPPSPTGTPPPKKGRFQSKWKRSAKQALLQWAQDTARELPVTIQDFGQSWRDGLAFAAVINALQPGLLDPADFAHRSDTENLEITFRTAERKLGIPRLLEAQDLAVPKPDEKSIMTYVSQFLKYSRELRAKELDTEETIGRFDSEILQRFLDTTDKVQSVSSPAKWQAVSELREELCRKWALVQPAVAAHLQRLSSGVEHSRSSLARRELEMEVELGKWSSHQGSGPTQQQTSGEACGFTEAEQHLERTQQGEVESAVRVTAGLKMQLPGSERGARELEEPDYTERLEAGRPVTGEPGAGMRRDREPVQTGSPGGSVVALRERVQVSGPTRMDSAALTLASDAEEGSCLDGVEPAEFGVVDSSRSSRAVTLPGGNPGMAMGALDGWSGGAGLESEGPACVVGEGRPTPDDLAPDSLGEAGARPFAEVRSAVDRDRSGSTELGSLHDPAPWARLFLLGEREERRFPTPDIVREAGDEADTSELAPSALAPPREHWDLQAREGSGRIPSGSQMDKQRAEEEADVVMPVTAGEQRREAGEWGVWAAGEPRSAGDRGNAVVVENASRGAGPTGSWAELRAAQQGQCHPADIPEGGGEDLPDPKGGGPSEAAEDTADGPEESPREEEHPVGAGEGQGAPPSTGPLEVQELTRSFPAESSVHEQFQHHSQEAGSCLPSLGERAASPSFHGQSKQRFPSAREPWTVLGDEQEPLGSPGTQRAQGPWRGAQRDAQTTGGRSPDLEGPVWPLEESRALGKDPLIGDGGARVGSSESPCPPVATGQGNDGARDTEGPIPQRRASQSSVGEVRVMDGSTAEVSRGQQTRENTDSWAQELLTAQGWSIPDHSQPPSDRSHAANVPAREDSGKSTVTTEQKSSAIPLFSLVAPHGRRLQDHEAGEEEGRRDEGERAVCSTFEFRCETPKEDLQPMKRLGGSSGMDPHQQPTLLDLREKLQGVQAALTEVTSRLSVPDAETMEVPVLFGTEPHMWPSATESVREELVQSRQALQHREESLRTALAALEGLEEEMAPLHSSLLQLWNEPVVLTGLSLKLEPQHQLLKQLQTESESQLERCEAIWSGGGELSGGGLEPGDQRAVCAVAHDFARRCREVGAQAQVAAAALGALEGFLQSLRAADAQGTAGSEEESRQLRGRAQQLDETLDTAGICLGSPGGRIRCWDLVTSLGCTGEAAGLHCMLQEQLVQEKGHAELCTRQKRLVELLQDIGRRAGAAALREATLPAVQSRLDGLTKLNEELQRTATELGEVRELARQLVSARPALAGEARERVRAAEEEWRATAGSVQDWQSQCLLLAGVLREFQNHKKDLFSTIQKGEDLIPQHSSYMGKEKLRQLMSDMDEVQREFGSQQEKLNGLRNLSRHLQSELRKVMPSGSLPFQQEADDLVDQWLDVTERLESRSYGLQRALSLWEEMTACGSMTGERARVGTDMLGESAGGREQHELEEKIRVQEQEIQTFHEKAVRIQELLEWKEVPLELQVVESAARKELEQMSHRRSQQDRAGVPSRGLQPLELQGRAAQSGAGEEQDGQLGLDTGVRGQQHSAASGDEQEELVWSDEEVTPTAGELPQIHPVEQEGFIDWSSGDQRLGETSRRRGQGEDTEDTTPGPARPLQVEVYRRKVWDARCLVNRLSAEEESVVRGPVESYTMHLVKVQILAQEVEKAKELVVELAKLGPGVSPCLEQLDHARLRSQLWRLGLDLQNLEWDVRRDLCTLSEQLADYHRHLGHLQELASSPATQDPDHARPEVGSELEGRRAALSWRQREVERWAQDMRGRREKEELAEATRRAREALGTTPAPYPGAGSSETLAALQGTLTRLRKLGGQLKVTSETVGLWPEDLCAQVEGHQAGVAVQLHHLFGRDGALVRGAGSRTAAEVGSLLAALQAAGTELQRALDSRLQQLTAALPGRRKVAAIEAELSCCLQEAREPILSGISRRHGDSKLEGQLSVQQEVLELSPQRKELLESLGRWAEEISPALTPCERTFLNRRLKLLARKFSGTLAAARSHVWRLQRELTERREFLAMASGLRAEAEEIQRLLREGGGEVPERAAGLRAGFRRLQGWSELLSGECRGQDHLPALHTLLAELEGSIPEELEQSRCPVSGGEAGPLFSDSPCQHQQRYLRERSECVAEWARLSDTLESLEVALGQSAAQNPASYAEAVEMEERQAALQGEISVVESGVAKLWARSRDLETMDGTGGEMTVSRAVSRLWEDWLWIQDLASERMLRCRDLREEWRDISEQVDRTTLALDHLGGAFPEAASEGASMCELLQREESVAQLQHDLTYQRSALRGLVCRATRLLGQEGDTHHPPPLLQELQTLLGHCQSLEQKIGESRRAIEEELRERERVLQEIAGLEDRLQPASPQLDKSGPLCDGAADTGLEVEGLHEERPVLTQLGHRYTEPYASVPADVTLAHRTDRALDNMEEKLGAQGSRNSRSQELSARIRETMDRLRNVEQMLQERSKTVSEAKAQHKRIWREIDEWYPVLSQLDGEVQELAEDDPELAQDLMEIVLDSFQQHQEVSRLAEQRTALVNKIPEYLEEYRQVTESADAWIQSTDAVLSDPIDCTSAKSLGKQLFALQVVTESSRQKWSGLQAVAGRQGALSAVVEVDEMAARVSGLLDTVTSRQQALVQRMHEVEQVATEIGAIESEVKTMESKVSKIHAILSSVDLDDFPILEHLANRQIILSNLEEMRAVSVAMGQCEKSLALPERVVGKVEVFTRLARVAAEGSMLEGLTTRQSALLESLLETLQENDTEIERLKKEKDLEAVEERLADLSEHRRSLMTSAQEALNQLIQTVTEGDRPPSPQDHQPKEPEPVNVRGKLSSLLEEDESEVEGEETVRSAEANQHSAPSQEPSTQGLEGLDVCWERAEELERWLESARDSLGASGWSRVMQSSVKEHLLQYQTVLQEIEDSLVQLSDCGTDQCPGLQTQFESLSLRLSSLRHGLEAFQAELEERPCAAQEQEAELSELTCPTEEVTKCTKRMWSEDQQRSPGEGPISTHPSTRDHGNPLPIQDPGEESTLHHQVVACWQQLQRTTESLQKLLEDSLEQGLGSEVFATAGGTCIVQGPTPAPQPAVEELHMWMEQLEQQGKEAVGLTAQTEGTVNQEARLTLERAVQNTALRISDWLEDTQEGLCSYSLGSTEEAERQLQHHQVLAATLEGVHREMTEQSRVLGQSDIFSCAEATVSLFGLQASLGLVLQRFSLVTGALRTRVGQTAICQGKLEQLRAALLERRTATQQRLVESAGCSAGEQLQLVEDVSRDLAALEDQLLDLTDEAAHCGVGQRWMQEVSRLQGVLDDTRTPVDVRRRELRHGLLVGRQYEELMQGLTRLLERGREKVTPGGTLPTRSIRDLQTHLQSYKLFFRRLENHLILAEQFSREVPEWMVARHRESWLELVDGHTKLQSEALRHGVYMETTLQAWAELEAERSVLMEEVEALSARVPPGELQEQTEERVTECIGTFKGIQDSLVENWPRMEEALRKGQVLLGALDSPKLEGQLHTLEHTWLSLRNRIHQELHRLEMLLEHWIWFQRESHAVDQWLELAETRLRNWEQEILSPTPEKGGNRLHLFLDFRKEVEGRTCSKVAAVSRGRQLLALRQAEGAALQAQLEQLEQRWAQLVGRLPGLQEQLQQLQVNKKTPSQVLSELGEWISDADVWLRQSAPEVQALGSSAAVKQALRTYQDYKLEVSCCQLAVDFVNQSLLQTSSRDVERDRYKKAEFAEQLGALNIRWERLCYDLNGKMQELDLALEAWTDRERSVQLLASWLGAQAERLQNSRRASSYSSVLDSLLDCQKLRDLLKVKEEELKMLRQRLPVVTELLTPGTAVESVETLAHLQDLCQSLAAEVIQLESILASRRQLWTLYQDSYEQVNGNVVRARYTLEHCTPPSCSLESAQLQVNKLQALQDTMACGQESWGKFQEASQRLREECCPPATIQLDIQCQATQRRWTCVTRDLSERLQAAGVELRLWQRFHAVYSARLAELQGAEERCGQLLTETTVEDNSQERFQLLLTHVQDSMMDLKALQEGVSSVCEAADELAKCLDDTVSATVQSDAQHLSGRVSRLLELLSLKMQEIQGLLEQHGDFQRRTENLERLLSASEEALKSNSGPKGVGQAWMETVKDQLLALTGVSRGLETLRPVSYSLAVSRRELRRAEDLWQRWERARDTAVAQCRERQGRSEPAGDFDHQQWRRLQGEMEEALEADVARNLGQLQEQLEAHQVLQVEITLTPPALETLVGRSPPPPTTQSPHSVPCAVSRCSVREVCRRFQRRQEELGARIARWVRFADSTGSLQRAVEGTSRRVHSMNELHRYSLGQVWTLLEELQLEERSLQRHRNSYLRTLELGQHLLSVADSQSHLALQNQLRQLQEDWESASSQLKDRRTELANIEEMCSRCGEEAAVLGPKFQELGEELKRPLPRSDEGLQKEQCRLQELEGTLRDWECRLTELSSHKTLLCARLAPSSATGFQGQTAHLEEQWKQLRLTESVRRREISHGLEQWLLFHTRSKELGDWLKQMEDRASHSTGARIEEMIERFQKDCVGELRLCEKSKRAVQQLGERLKEASEPSRAGEIDSKLQLIDNRWQHLVQLIESRVKNWKDTQSVLQTLGRDMSSLRSWLTHIESELSKPLVYNICDDQEIAKKLAEQQELQCDIEQHSVGVTSVLSLCDGLLLDTETEAGCDSVQQTTGSLDRRWRNICAMSVERRMKIEETWRLWQKFLEDYARFEDWLQGAEQTAADPHTSQVPYTLAKEELKKYESFQRQIHESLTQLELINKQYRRLARERRTDTASRLKHMVFDGNQRWDNLQRRIAAILRRLKHFTNQKEEFESCREGIVVWLTEMDLQLTNVEHFSESDVADKVRQLNAFQQEITLNTNKIDQLIVTGEQLIQKIEPLDAVDIEEELEELHTYCQEVFGRVARFHQRLMSKWPPVCEETAQSAGLLDAERGEEAVSLSLESGDGSSEEVVCPLPLPEAPQPQEKSGRETPVSVDSIPLEWDHTVDVGGSSSHDEDDGMFFTTLSDVEIAESPAAFVTMTESSLAPSTGEPSPEPTDWSPNLTPVASRSKGVALRQRQAAGPAPDPAHRQGYAKLLSECSGSTDVCRRGPDSQSDEDPQHLRPEEATVPEQPVSGVVRWDLLHAQTLSKELLIKQNLQQWQQLTSDLDNISSWLGSVEPALQEARTPEPPCSLAAIQDKLRSLGNVQKELDKYKALVISANLSSRDFLHTDSAEAQEIQDKLHQVNGNWNRTSQSLQDSWASLHSALLQSEDLRHTTRSLLMWLANCESRHRLVQLADPALGLQTLMQHRRDLMELETELRARQPQVNGLEEVGRQLLEGSEEPRGLDARQEIRAIASKARGLLQEVVRDLRRIDQRLDVSPIVSVDDLDFTDVPKASTPLRYPVDPREIRLAKAQPVSMERAGTVRRVEGPSRGKILLRRVVWAALPLYLLILLLFLLASLIPILQQDYSCALANNFARSLYPMLRYTNGPPPT